MVCDDGITGTGMCLYTTDSVGSPSGVPSTQLGGLLVGVFVLCILGFLLCVGVLVGALKIFILQHEKYVLKYYR